MTVSRPQDLGKKQKGRSLIQGILKGNPHCLT